MITQSCCPHICFYLAGNFYDLFPVCPCKFNHKNGAGITLYKKPVFALLNIIFGAFQYIMIDQFTGAGFILQCNQVCP